MPLTAKGEKIKAAMGKEYGAEKGASVFYASKNAGKISGVDMNGGVEGLKSYGDNMSEGSEGLKSYGEDENHHHEVQGETGPEIEDKRRDAGMGLVHAKEEKIAEHEANPKPLDATDAKFTHSFPNDPFGDKMPDGGFEWHKMWTAEQMKDSPFAIYKE